MPAYVFVSDCLLYSLVEQGNECDGHWPERRSVRRWLILSTSVGSLAALRVKAT